MLEAVLKIPQKENFEDIYFYFERRKKNQPYGKTCGSYFKNVNIKDLTSLNLLYNSIKSKREEQVLLSFIKNWKIPAGRLIQKVGLKWYDIWWVKVSEKHANFIINYNNTDSSKILKLADIIKSEVKEKLWVELKEEVIIV